MEDFKSTFEGDSCSLKFGSYSVVPTDLSISFGSFNGTRYLS